VGVRRPAPCAPVEGLGFGRKGESKSTRRSAALAARRGHGHDVAEKYSVKNSQRAKRFDAAR
jgi:hypothetical protein